MIRSITLGSRVMVQGSFVRPLIRGRPVVQVDEKLFSGQLV